jgi:serine/threonine-protein kinase
MPDLFISYKRENEAKVARLVAALEAQGLDVWWDREIPAGAPWEATIEQQLAEAKAVIVCWSRAAVASDNVRSEARLARNQVRLIQVFVEPCEPPLFFGERQGIDLSNWRGKADDPRIARLANAARAIAEGKAADLPAVPKARLALSRRAMLAAVLLLLIAATAGWLLVRPVTSTGPVTLAVLPFRALAVGDGALTEAIADDTRAAIGRNPNLRVLGRLAVSELAKQGLAPGDYRRKVGADYLLDGSVQRSGPQVRIKVNLVRTKDGAEVWSDRLGGKLDDIFAFQSRIASEVEGRIRGRLAPGRGIKPENITTSGEVYALFAEARSHVRKRDPDGFKRGIALLEKALALDPNFAPAWAELGIATRIQGGEEGQTIDQVRAESLAHLKRALTLAPNLATAHAAVAMVQDMNPSTEGSLRKAVELDPNDAQTWMWLGNMQLSQNKVRQALVEYERASGIEPLWSTPIGNMMTALVDLRDKKGIDRLLQKVDRTGDSALGLKARFYAAINQGRPNEAIRILVRLRTEHPSESSYVKTRLYRPLLQLGFIDEVGRLFDGDQEIIQLYKGVAPSPATIRSWYKRPIDLWLDGEAAALFARLLPRHGRLQEFVGYYKTAFSNPDAFFDLWPGADKALFRQLAPNVAVILRAAGKAAEADAILRRNEQVLAAFLKNGPALPDMLMNLAQLRAAQGRDDEAVRLLGQAVNRGWLPQGATTAIDIAEEPCFAQLVKRADFQRFRKRILDRIAAERRIAAPAVAAAKL